MKITNKKNIPLRTEGVTVLAFDGNRVLLLHRLRRPMADSWSFIAGKIRKNESAWKSALRELKEETGIKPRSFHSPGIVEQYYNPENNSLWLRPVFIALVPARSKVVLNHEHDMFSWFEPADAEKTLPCFSQRMALASAWSMVKDGSVKRLPNLV